MSEEEKTVGRGRTAKGTKARPTRIPMSGSRKRMHIPDEYKDSAYHYAWITDRNDLVFRAKRAGFEHVRVSEMPQLSADIDMGTDTTGPIRMNVGAGDIAFLMKQPMEFYEEDRAELRKINQSKVADIKRGIGGEKEGQYGKIEIS